MLHLWKLFLLWLLRTCCVHAVVLTHDNQCRILAFFPNQLPGSKEESGEGKDYYPRWTQYELERVSQSFIATARLAVEHFNTRNTVVVPELANLDENNSTCKVQLSLDVFTEHVNAKRGGQIMLQEGRDVCAVLGTYDYEVARAMQPTSASLDLPQVIYYTLNQFLTSPKRPTAVGFPPTILSRARALAEYLNSGQVEPAREYMAMIYEEAYPSSFLAQCFQEDAAEKYGLISTKFQDDHFGIIPSLTAEELQRKVLQNIKETGIRTIFLNKIESSSLYLTAQLLEEFDMLTTEYVYIFTPQAVPTDAVDQIFGPQLVNSPFDKLLRGGMVLDHVDPFRVNPETDPFLAVWKLQGAETLLRWPLSENSSSFFPNNDSSYFQTTTPADYASFLYDAVISIGMGACHATTNKAANDTSPFRSDILSTNFTGASGRIEWGCFGPNRCNDAIRYGIFNIRAVPVPQTDKSAADSKPLNTYKTVLTAVWDKDQRWQKVAPFIYQDGSQQAPTMLIQPQENNYLSSGVRGFGLFLYLTAAGTSLAGIIALVRLRHERTVTRSQPFFLACMCLGSLIMSTAILTLSFDETSLNGSISGQGLDAACVSTVWFFFTGHVLEFAALFAKLWRLDRTLQFRRGGTSRERALKPMLGLVAATSLILIVWTILDPYRWERELISLLPAETFGRCKSDHFWAFFGPLMANLILAEGLTLFFSYRTADVSDEFNDTQWALSAIFTQFQAWIVGVPILAVLKDASADAVYLSRALLIWVFSISGVLLVVGNRMYKALFGQSVSRRGPSSGSVVRVSGLDETQKSKEIPQRSIRDSLTTRMDGHGQPSVSSISAAMTRHSSNRISTVSSSPSINLTPLHETTESSTAHAEAFSDDDFPSKP